jgi:hypothetical protein
VSYGTQITLDAPFADAVTRVREALAAQGFGVLTEIDVAATMRARLGEEMEDVRAESGGTLVEALDPQVMVTLTGRAELKPVSDEVARRLAAALAALAA